MNDWDDDNKSSPHDPNDDFDMDDLFGWADDDEAEDVSEMPDDMASQQWRMSHPSLVERQMEQDIEDAEDAAFGNTRELLDWMADSDNVSTAGDEAVDFLAGLPTAGDDAQADEDIDLINRVSGNSQRAHLEDTDMLNQLAGQSADVADTDFLNDLTQSDQAASDKDTGMLNTLATGEDSVVDTGRLDALASTGQTDKLNEATVENDAPEWDLGAVFADMELDNEQPDAVTESSEWDVGDTFMGIDDTDSALSTQEQEEAGWGDVADTFLGIEDEPPPPSVRAPKFETSEWEVGDTFVGIDDNPAPKARKLRETGEVKWDESGAEFLELSDDEYDPVDPRRKKQTGTFDWGDTGTLAEEEVASEPDWLADMGLEDEPEASAEPEADVPDWLTGMDFEDDVPASAAIAEPEADVPDWLTGMDFEDDAPEAEDDFSFFEEAMPEPEPASADIENLLADFDTIETTDDSLDDLLAEMGEADDDDDLSDLLAGLEDAPVETGSSLDDLLNDDADMALSDLATSVEDEPVADLDDLFGAPLEESAETELDDAFGALFNEADDEADNLAWFDDSALADEPQATSVTNDLDNAFDTLFDEADDDADNLTWLDDSALADEPQATSVTDDLDNAFDTLFDDADDDADNLAWLGENALADEPQATSVTDDLDNAFDTLFDDADDDADNLAWLDDSALADEPQATSVTDDLDNAFDTLFDDADDDADNLAWLDDNALADEPQATSVTDDLDNAFDNLFDDVDDEAVADAPDWFDDSALADEPQATSVTDDLDNAFDTLFDETTDEAVADAPDWLSAMEPEIASDSPIEAAPQTDDDFMANLFSAEDDDLFGTGELEGATGEALAADWLNTSESQDESVDAFASMFGEDDPVDEPLDEAFASMFGTDDPDDGFNWETEPDAAEAEPDWLSNLDADDFMLEAETDQDDFAMLFDEADDEDSFGFAEPAQPIPTADLDALIDSFDLDDDEQLVAPSNTDELRNLLGDDDFEFDDEDDDFERFDEFDEPLAEPAADLDSIFGTDEADFALDAAEADFAEFDENAPDWLREAAAAGAAASTAAQLMQERQDRPIDDLNDRLLSLRDRGLNLTTDDEDIPIEEAEGSGIIPIAQAALNPARFNIGQADLVTEPTLTPEQEKNAAILSALIGTSAGAAFATMTSDQMTDKDQDNFFLDDSELATLDDVSLPPDPVSAESGGRPPRPLPSRIERLVITAVLLAAVMIPIFSTTIDFGSFWSQPLEAFDGATQELQNRAFILAETDVQANDLVLIAADYGPSGAYELDALLEAIATHLSLRGARPVIVSTNAVGLLRADAIVSEIYGGNRQQFFTARFLAGGQIGLRDLVNRTPDVLSIDVYGDPTNLSVTSLDDFVLGYIVTDSIETARLYVEQVLPNSQPPFIMVTGQAAKPVVTTYVEGRTDLLGMLNGYADAVTYSEMVQARNVLDNLSGQPAPIIRPTNAPTEIVPEVEITPTETQIEPTQTSVEAEPTQTTADIEPTQTSVETEPTEADVIEASPTTDVETPADEPTVATTPEVTEAADTNSDFVTGTITANVRLRTGPGTGFGEAGFASAGEQVIVLDISNSGDWVQIQLENGTEAWVNTTFIEINREADANAGAKNIPSLIVLARRGANDIQQDTTEDPTDLATPTTEALQPLPTVAPTSAPITSNTTIATNLALEGREPRWNATMIGTVAAIIIIGLGSILSIVRWMIGRN